MSRVGAIILAAGLSSRMGRDNKLLADMNGVPVIVHAARAVVASRAVEVCVVTGHQAGQLESMIQEMPVNIAFNRDFAQGMAGSIAVGMKALTADSSGSAIILHGMITTGPRSQRAVSSMTEQARQPATLMSVP